MLEKRRLENPNVAARTDHRWPPAAREAETTQSLAVCSDASKIKTLDATQEKDRGNFKNEIAVCAPPKPPRELLPS